MFVKCIYGLKLIKEIGVLLFMNTKRITLEEINNVKWRSITIYGGKKNKFWRTSNVYIGWLFYLG